MIHQRERCYRIVSGMLCAAFALVGMTFLLQPAAVLTTFDGWSRAAGLATSVGEPGELYVVLAAAYMYVVTSLAWAMYRHPDDPAPAHLLIRAKLASAVLSFAVFFLRQPHLVLLVNGMVDGSIGVLLILLLRVVDSRAAERTT